MEPERWRKIERLCNSALDLAPDRREAFLDEACAGDESIRREVQQLLELQSEAEDFIESPAMEKVARRIAPDSEPSKASPSMTGKTLGHYRVGEQLGRGGMGVVYKAQDLHLDRFVALKILPPETVADSERKRRFVQEAKAASALNHPNIVIIHDIAREVGTDFIAMEYVAGKTLAQLIPESGLPLSDALKCAIQIADALSKAHSAGIVHRDLKPSNIMVNKDGLVKVLDFGLAKLTHPEPSAEAETRSLEPEETLTKEGTILGTVSYMSPEQVEGKRLDARSDVFSFGAVLYEMLTGRRAFPGDSKISIMSAILRDPPVPAKQIRPDVPRGVERLLQRCLEKDREARYPSGVELLLDLHALESQFYAAIGASGTFRRWIRRPRVAVPASIALLALCFAGLLAHQHYARVQWAREKALPDIGRLIDQGNYVAAFNLAQQAEIYIPSDAMLARLWPEMSQRVSIKTTPPGADIYMKEYSALHSKWRPLGKSPLANVRIPQGYFRWRLTLPGYETIEAAQNVQNNSISFTLHAKNSVPPGMVSVPAGPFILGNVQLGLFDPLDLGQYWIDRYEVTNRQFKEFIDHGGYQNRQYWNHAFVKEGRVLSWKESMELFRDSTGRPGPLTWEAGICPEGKDDYPVSGVSWYEAAAYAEYAGKQLPTVYHWYRAADPWQAAHFVPLSNFGGSGLNPVGSGGMSAYGTYDMAGNVREWCWNEADGKRFILGGAWNEPSYIFSFFETRIPWDRSPANGFRCVKYSGRLDDTLTTPLHPRMRDYSKEKPVSDETFRVFRSMYAREPGPLDARIESTDASSEYWTMQRVSFNADSPRERMPACLVLPKNAVPPYQTLIFFPGRGALLIPSISQIFSGTMQQLDFVVKSGRAILFPTWKGIGERQIGLNLDQDVGRDVIAQWIKDLGASIDYLESRSDIDRGKIGYIGGSMGANRGPILTALESRIKLEILLDGGFWPGPRAPEVDDINYAPRVRVPVLMINGRFDFLYPPDLCQIPMFRLLGTPDKDKKHVILDSAHDVLSMRSQTAREVLDWLDRYWGPTR